MDVVWNSIEDRMPNPGVMVIVACRCAATGQCHTGVAWRFKDTGGWNTRQSDVDLSGIEYWSPLPEPPKVMTEAKFVGTTDESQ